MTALVTAGVAFVVALVVVAATADVLRTAATARTAADAAALSAVGASPLVGGPGNPRDRARDVAERGGAVLVDCVCGAPDMAEVTVAVEPRLAIVRLAQPVVQARSRAELRPAHDP